MNHTSNKQKLNRDNKKCCPKEETHNLCENSYLSDFYLEKFINSDSKSTTVSENSILLQALDKFNDGAYISNQDYALLYASPSLKSIFGAPENKKCFKYIYNRDDICPWCRNKDVFSGKVVSWEQDFDSTQKVYEILELPLLISNKVTQKLTLYRDITKHKQAKEQLRNTHINLIKEQVKLRQRNLALNEISKQIDYEKNLLKNNIQNNINRIVLPLVDIIKDGRNHEQDIYFKMLNEALDNITTSFISKLESKYSKLSPRELEICNLIRNEISSKQIADALNISIQTVNGRRKDIRKKLGLTNKKINLSTYLKSH